MAATDSRPVPIKNTAYRVIFPILDADGDLVTGAAGLDSEVSKDCGTFADCTNEATEIATSSGVYYLDLTSTEMNADSVAVIVKTTTTGAKTTTIVLYPQESGDIKVDVQSYGGTAGTFSGGRPEVNTTHAAGTAWGSGAITAASIAASALNGKGDWNIGKTGYSLTQTFPTNFSALAITAGGAVTAGTVSDKTGYSLTATTGLGNQTANITGNLSGSVGSVTGAVGSVTGNVGGNVTGSVGSIATGGIAAASFAAGAINAAAIAADAIGASELAADAVAEIADAVWDEARAGHVAAGSFGEGVASVQGNVTGSVGSVTGAVGSVTGAVGSVTGNVGGNVVGSVASVTAGVTVTTNNDKTGYRLSATGVDDIWDEATSGHTTAGTTGKALTDAGSAGDPWTTSLPGSYSSGQAGYIIGTNLNATVSSRLASASYTAPLDAAGTRSAVGLASANLDTQLSTIDTVVDSILVDTAEIGTAGAGLTALATQASVNTIDDFLDTEIAAIKAKTDNLPAAPAASSDCITAAGVRTAVGLASANLDTQIGTLATSSALSTVAGYLDTEVAAILAAVDTEVGAIKAKTDNLPASPAAVSDIPTATQNADALLNRDMSAVSDTNARSPLNAFRFIRNKWSVSGTTLTVTKENDSTTAWTATLTQNAAADPVTGSDPA